MIYLETSVEVAKGHRNSLSYRLMRGSKSLSTGGPRKKRGLVEHECDKKMIPRESRRRICETKIYII